MRKVEFTHQAKAAEIEALTILTARSGLSTATKIQTHTSRAHYLISAGSKSYILKRSNYDRHSSTDPLKPVSVAEEIKASQLLQTVVTTIPPDSFSHISHYKQISLEVEVPIAAISDIDQEYALYRYINLLSSGEILKWEEPPTPGAYYDPTGWVRYCAVADVMDVVCEESLKSGLVLNDPGVHQTLYSANETTGELKVVFIDTEHVTLISKPQS